jgi:hypothetical protein
MPSRPVLHLAIGLAQAVEAAERRILLDHPDPSFWLQAGLDVYEVGTPKGGVRHQPRLMQMHLLTLPAVSRFAISLGEQLLPATQAYLASGRARHLAPMIRLFR